ncbi:nitrogen regulatory protein PII [Candidatus Scalindua japonica]|uniref:Nitrogen regulatory protein PII n=1 Tax=Candidatus Scalindua japonica TaxID=1284222 RepID=A0A286TTE8_9BACT|nr:P-II family nitrogen regulator [Candidatus Scalindua japonica]GAX59157.1 nitrogen regulatory protein PII [Candidatus Scalindua japonica]
MKRVTAFIKPMALEILEDYFGKIGYPVLKMCINDDTQVANRTLFWRDEEYLVDLIKNVKIEVILDENVVEEAVQNISKHLYKEDCNDCQYEYALRLKSSMVRDNIITKDGRWVSLPQRQEQLIQEQGPVAQQQEVLEIMDV